VDKLGFALEIKSFDEKGLFSGFASVYNNVDRGGDVVSPGAFQKTLQSRGGEVPILFSHDTHRPVGIGKVEDSAKGLIIHGRLTMAVPDAQATYALMKDGVLRGLSIGYSSVRDEVQNGVRYLREIKLFEVSLCVFPMNEAATVTTVKAADAVQLADLKNMFWQYRIQQKGL
jgi:uncharacterized protein